MRQRWFWCELCTSLILSVLGKKEILLESLGAMTARCYMGLERREFKSLSSHFPEFHASLASTRTLKANQFLNVCCRRIHVVRNVHISDLELQDHRAGWTSMPYEYDYYLDEAWVDGQLPLELQGGTMYGVGPGLTEAYGSVVRHPEDADGMVWSLAIAAGATAGHRDRIRDTSSEGASGHDRWRGHATKISKATRVMSIAHPHAISSSSRMFFRNKFVRTNSFVAEQVTGRRVSRGLHDRGAPAASSTNINAISSTSSAVTPATAASVTPGTAATAASDLRPSPLERLISVATSMSNSLLPNVLQGAPSSADINPSNKDVVGIDFMLNHAGNSVSKSSPPSQSSSSLIGDDTAGLSTANNESSSWSRALLSSRMIKPAGRSVWLESSVGGFINAASASIAESAGFLGPLFNPLDFSFRTPANASVLYVGGALYALTEQGLPYELNKMTLDTIGQSTLSGLLDSSPSGVTAAHRWTPPSGHSIPCLKNNTQNESGAGGGASSGPPSQRGPKDALWRKQQETTQPLGMMADGRTATSSISQASSATSSSKQCEDRLVLLSVAQSGMDAVLQFWELDANSTVISRPHPYRVPGCLAQTVTDFLVTDQYFLVLQAPVTLNMERMATRYTLGDASFAECLDYDDSKPAKLHLIPRLDRGLRHVGALDTVVVDLPAMIMHRGVHACEVLLGNGGGVVMDAVMQKGLSHFKDMTEVMPGYYKGEPKPTLTRITVDINLKTATVEGLSHRSMENGAEVHTVVRMSSTFAMSPIPVFPPRIFFASTSAADDKEHWGPPQVLTRLEVAPTLQDLGQNTTYARVGSSRRGSTCEIWNPGPRSFLGPVLLVPKADGRNEDDVWIVTTVHNAEARRVEIVVLDGSEPLRNGPVCSIQLPHHLPYPRTLKWVPQYLGPGRVAPSSWKPLPARR
ncbi:hypothetical protein CEUSTIGMA_g9038.t1 [Chlamydomonas eustigma]|uniref:Uncharacterized protein n=1 Tax=Chlamydomonas eustigma TaxID=1157962 RepID=A0A250XFP4_9CHLO|nr:hypothetical protein CEUSTIGMA_g9038.t1 [Chlamydomonas eustigma]|eukprot:GAX81610.1 hypothetical protein CEUSTIGMA_g9038.t1 [Chlamydomonas eustigma]